MSLIIRKNLLFILFLIILKSAGYADTKEFNNQLVGSWLNFKYYQAIIKSKSPLIAAKNVYDVYFEIEGNNEFTWRQIYNFHEGVTLKIINIENTEKQNKYKIITNQKRDKNNPVFDYFTIDKNYNLTKILWRHEWYKFEFLFEERESIFVKLTKPLHIFINESTIAGSYIDNKNKKYIFTSDGVAKWPNKEFKYKIQTDMIFQSCDYFLELNDKNANQKEIMYSFEFKNKQLLIYNTYFSQEQSAVVKANNPLLILFKSE